MKTRSVLTHLCLCLRLFLWKEPKQKQNKSLMNVQPSRLCDLAAVVYFSTDCIWHLYEVFQWVKLSGPSITSVFVGVNIHRAVVLIWIFSVEVSTLLLSYSGVHLKLPVEFWCKQTAEFTLSFTTTRLRPPAPFIVLAAFPSSHNKSEHTYTCFYAQC